ncbi:MAG TPA: Chromate resistance protein ChrB [Chloroflexota bacterium]|nr:Chromate resistance protein ChrB [Chloroflexota bacterium]
MEGAAAPAGTWVLLVYTVPAAPSRKRATVWREVKRLGALYLRDGVCALPEAGAARAGLEALAERVRELDGQATIVWNACLSPATAALLSTEWTRSRQLEYAEVAEAAADLLRHIERETEHHAFERAELMSLNGDLARLERWLRQVIGRDYLGVGDPAPITATLTRCQAALDGQAALSS